LNASGSVDSGREEQIKREGKAAKFVGFMINIQDFRFLSPVLEKTLLSPNDASRFQPALSFLISPQVFNS